MPLDSSGVYTDEVDIEMDTLIINKENENLDTNRFVIAKSNKYSKRDSVQIKKHCPKTASWLAIIPGAGQIYNKKYWKLPIVYGGLSATGFLIYYYEDKASIYRKEYVARINENTENLNPKLADVSDAVVLELRNYYRRNMEICVAVCAVVYLLSILDACVDAHLHYYDISENLAIAVKPKINFNTISGAAAPSMALVFKF